MMDLCYEYEIMGEQNEGKIELLNTTARFSTVPWSAGYCLTDGFKSKDCWKHSIGSKYVARVGFNLDMRSLWH